MNRILKEGIRLRVEGYYMQRYSNKNYSKLREWLIKFFLKLQLKKLNK